MRGKWKRNIVVFFYMYSYDMQWRQFSQFESLFESELFLSTRICKCPWDATITFGNAVIRLFWSFFFTTCLSIPLRHYLVTEISGTDETPSLNMSLEVRAFATLRRTLRKGQEVHNIAQFA